MTNGRDGLWAFGNFENLKLPKKPLNMSRKIFFKINHMFGMPVCTRKMKNSVFYVLISFYITKPAR